MNLWDGLKSSSGIEWSVPKLEISLETGPLAEELAKAVAATVSSNLLAGKRPDGKPLPPVAAGTAERRRYRAAQAARGGEASARVTDPAKRARVKANWQRRMGGAGAPRNVGQTGLETGKLARSIQASRGADGWVISVAGERGARGAAARVFAKLGGLGAGVMLQPRVQTALGNIVKKIFKVNR